MMGTTMFLSMWMNNTSTTAMIVPIVSAIMKELHKVRPYKYKVQIDYLL
jgi:di/tricarboxylate transporter